MYLQQRSPRLFVALLPRGSIGGSISRWLINWASGRSVKSTRCSGRVWPFAFAGHGRVFMKKEGPSGWPELPDRARCTRTGSCLAIFLDGGWVPGDQAADAGAGSVVTLPGDDIFPPAWDACVAAGAGIGEVPRLAEFIHSTGFICSERVYDARRDG